MSRELPSISSPLHFAADDPDPELAALPDPPRRERRLTVAVLALAACAALAMVFALRHDALYALLPGRTASLGDLAAATAGGLARYENRLVRADASLGAAGGIRYERLVSHEAFRAMPVAGRRDIWVEVRVPPGDQAGRWQAPRSFAGRLVRFDAAGLRHQGLKAAIEWTTHERLPNGAWLLVDGEVPGDVQWGLILTAAFLAFAGWHMVVIGRILRRLR